MNSQKKSEVISFLAAEIQRVKTQINPGAPYSVLPQNTSSAETKRFYNSDAREMTEIYLNSLNKLIKEIQDQKDFTNNKAKPVSLVEIEYDDGSHLEFFLVDNAVSLPQYLFVSAKSPLGLAVYGKSVGDEFSYILKNSGDKSFSGIIHNIE